jgi:hypothetical protein
VRYRHHLGRICKNPVLRVFLYAKSAEQFVLESECTRVHGRGGSPVEGLCIKVLPVCRLRSHEFIIVLGSDSMNWMRT